MAANRELSDHPTYNFCIRKSVYVYSCNYHSKNKMKSYNLTAIGIYIFSLFSEKSMLNILFRRNTRGRYQGTNSHECLTLVRQVRGKERAEPWFGRFGEWIGLNPGSAGLEFGKRPVPFSVTPNSCRFGVWRKDWAETWFSRFGVRRKVSSMAGSEFGERTVPNLGSAVLKFGERTWPNPGSAGSEFGLTLTLTLTRVFSLNSEAAEPRFGQFLSPNFEPAEPGFSPLLSPDPNS